MNFAQYALIRELAFEVVQTAKRHSNMSNEHSPCCYSWTRAALTLVQLSLLVLQVTAQANSNKYDFHKDVLGIASSVHIF